MYAIFDKYMFLIGGCVFVIEKSIFVAKNNRMIVEKN